MSSEPQRATPRLEGRLLEIGRLNRLKIGSRLTVCFAIVMVLMTLGSLVALWQARVISSQAQRLHQVGLEAEATLRVHADLVVFRDRLRGYVEAHQAERFAAEIAKGRSDLVDDVERARRVLSAFPADAERHAPMLSTLETIRSTLPEQMDTVIDLVKAGDWQAASRRLENQVRTYSQVTGQLVEEINTEVAQEQRLSLDNIRQVQRLARRILLVVIGFALLIAAALGVAVTRSITGPLARLDAGAQALARGDFQHRVNATGSDELANLSRVFNDTAVQLRDLYGALQRSEARFRSLLENASDLITVLNREGTIVYASPSSERVGGYATKALVGKTIFDFVHPDDVALTKSTFVPLVLTGTISPPFELRFRHGDGSWRVFEVIANNLLENPAVAGVVVNSRDVTERKHAEEALRKSEEEYRAFFEQDLAGNYTTTPEGTILTCNPAFVRMFGFTSVEEAKAANTVLLYPSREAREDFLRLLRNQRQVENLDEEFRRKDGSPLYAILSAVGKFNEQGGLVEIRGYLLDQSERRKAEQQLRQAQKMEAVGRLAGGIAHDFNNLLCVITGYSEILLTSLDSPDPRREKVEEIRKASDRAASLTRQLLAFSRQQVLQPAVLNLNAVVEDIDKMLRRLIGEDIELVTRPYAELGRVKADRGQIEQVILNLAVNARDAMPQGGRFTVETANVELNEEDAREHPTVKPGAYVMLAVSDTGIGMDERTRANIFEPFFTTKEMGRGTGLGLATVYGIVKQSGGFVWFYSEVGQGTRFEVYLPRVDEPVPVSGRGMPLAPAPRGSETILLVEDEAPLRRLTRMVLEGNGYTVLESASAAEALAIAEKHDGPLPLLVTDVVMPGLSGRVLAQRLMALRPEMRVLYISGYTDNTLLEHGVLGPGLAFLQKPYTLDAIVRKVRETLDGA